MNGAAGENAKANVVAAIDNDGKFPHINLAKVYLESNKKLGP